jgi:outer membrane protein assembly factor BamB
MKLHIFVLVVMGFITTTYFSCKSEETWVETKDDVGIVQEKAFIWQVSNTANPKLAGGVASNSLIIKGDILDTYTDVPEKNSNQITLLDNETGKRIWVWKDLILDNERIDFSRRAQYNYQNFLLYHHGPRSYCINTQTGKTFWKQWNLYSGFPNLCGLGSVYFSNGTPWGQFNKSIQEDRVYKTDLRTGNQTEIVMPRYNPENARPDMGYSENRGFISEVFPVVQQQDTLLIIAFNESHKNRNQFEAYISLYNMTQKSWVYERKPIDIPVKEGFNRSWLITKGEKMYTILNNWLVCSNWQTGAKIWAKAMPSFAQSPTLIENDKYLVAVSTDSRLYLLNPDTGEEIWQVKETTSGADFYYDKGILYYLSDRLCAREIPSGKKIWNIKSPTDGKIDGFFWVFVTGLRGKDGQKGRIFTRTGYHTYCFEAIK